MKKNWFIFLVLLLFAAFVYVEGNDIVYKQPEQIHLSYPGNKAKKNKKMYVFRNPIYPSSDPPTLTFFFNFQMKVKV